MLVRKLYFKIKRKLFYWFNGFYPEDFKKLCDCQKILESLDRSFYEKKSYKDIINEVFNV